MVSHSSPLPHASNGDAAVGMEVHSECWDFPRAVHGMAMVGITLTWPPLSPSPTCSQSPPVYLYGPRTVSVVKFLLSVPQIRS